VGGKKKNAGTRSNPARVEMEQGKKKRHQIRKFPESWKQKSACRKSWGHRREKTKSQAETLELKNDARSKEMVLTTEIVKERNRCRNKNSTVVSEVATEQTRGKKVG